MNKKRLEERRNNIYITNSRGKRFYRGDMVEVTYHRRGTFYPTPKTYIGKIVHVPRSRDVDSMICVKSDSDYIYIYINEIKDIRSAK